ncbi:MAG: RluA family pseudouridine synthase [Planctomycetota bacterium]|jgi:23S rRNA pseudouridine1911/1915/1917 synthase
MSPPHEHLRAGRDLSEVVEELELVVRAAERIRLDHYLQSSLGWKSRTKVQRLITMGRVEVEGRPGKPAMKVGRGDRITIRLVLENAEREEHPPLAPPLWEDPYLLAIAKPPRRLVHPTGRTIGGTVIDEVHRRFAPLNARGRRAVVPRLCHRLDRDTSGLLLVAKTAAIRRAVQVAFEANEVRKGYLAVVEGEPAADRFEVDAAISDAIDRSRAHSNRLSRIDEEEGRASLTRFRVLGRGPGHAVIHCLPVTGRQNQIRVHLASVGHPILGDTGYGSSPEGAALPEGLPFPDRALLHSLQLRFRHPVWGTERELRAPVDRDLRPFLRALAIDEARIAPTPGLPRSPAVRAT